MKLATGKVTLPGRKQVWRLGERDVVGLHDEPVDGRPLLAEAMRGGRRTAPPEQLDSIRDRCTDALAALPPHLRSLEPADTPLWPVDTAPGLQAMADVVRQGHAGRVTTGT
jgi:nicotinate phosphoribosyltransferase